MLSPYSSFNYSLIKKNLHFLYRIFQYITPDMIAPFSARFPTPLIKTKQYSMTMFFSSILSCGGCSGYVPSRYFSCRLGYSQNKNVKRDVGPFLSNLLPIHPTWFPMSFPNLTSSFDFRYISPTSSSTVFCRWYPPSLLYAHDHNHHRIRIDIPWSIPSSRNSGTKKTHIYHVQEH